MIYARFCLLHRICFNTKRKVFRFCQTIVALCKLCFQHLTVFSSDRVKLIFSVRNTDTLLKTVRIGTHIHKGQLKMNGAVEEIKETTPLFKNGGLIFLLCQLIIDVLKLDCLCVIIISHTTNAIREHPLERNGLLCCSGNTIIISGFLNNFLNLLLFSLCQIYRYFYLF